MTSSEIRKSFHDFFKSKQHEIVGSAPMVVKNDPTLMFTNAGMNQFKDIFLGNKEPQAPRIANTQKCLRVSGKHNDLEEVGLDTCHHTMFEMLGNWSFGDYFKKETIAWAFEYLVEVLKIPADRLFATIFKGSPGESLERDGEAYVFWSGILKPDHILDGSKKDNFWEMGDTGPCGPCSEIHIDLRPDKEREKVPGSLLVNKDHPLVIEIWNLVFIQYNRLSNGTLERLPLKHVDTGLGFERLCMVVQGHTSNYDTDLFQSIIAEISAISKIKYGKDEKSDIAMRVVADHLRAVSFSIADGQLPSNVKAGYVIRRILRRAIRYGYSFLGLNDPFIYKLVPVLAKNLGSAFPELLAQESFISRVIREEEASFLKTLETGIRKLEELTGHIKKQNRKILSGASAFLLYDTYGFPLDLSELILKEQGLKVNRNEFRQHMDAQKIRSRNAGKQDADDWVELAEIKKESFLGYKQTEAQVHIAKYRKVVRQNKTLYHLVMDATPFYAESGGQVGDQGFLITHSESIEVIDTRKENELTIHITGKLPEDPGAEFTAAVNPQRRLQTACNHTATHLLHKALRHVLGAHVEQKGSLVHPDYLRFDFSHFRKPGDDELLAIEENVNADIRANHAQKSGIMNCRKAIREGAIALFGEKYTENVRIIRFGDSKELCGGTHVQATGQIGFFKITSEGSTSSGVRRIEAITGRAAESYVHDQEALLSKIRELLNGAGDIEKTLEDQTSELRRLRKIVETGDKEKLKNLKQELLKKQKQSSGVNTIIEQVDQNISVAELKDLAFQLREQVDQLFCFLGLAVEGKAHLILVISDPVLKSKNLNASTLIREFSKPVQGGGGGEAFIATAGGKNAKGIPEALKMVKEFVSRW